MEFDGTQYYLDYNRPHSIGKLRKFYGVPAVVLRAYAYIRSLGADGLKQVSELAILNNNYLLKKLASVRGALHAHGRGQAPAGAGPAQLGKAVPGNLRHHRRH